LKKEIEIHSMKSQQKSSTADAELHQNHQRFSAAIECELMNKCCSVIQFGEADKRTIVDEQSI
jgi:hypothetical protein